MESTNIPEVPKKEKWKRIPYDSCALETEDEKGRYEGDFPLEVCGKKFVFHQEVVKTLGSVGLTVWDSSIVLAKYMEVLENKTPGFFEDKRVIELGAGCGLVGLVLGKQLALVTLTDLPSIVPFLEKNINLNGCSSNVVARSLIWGEIALNEEFDYIVASDCLWVHYLVEPFVKQLEQLATSKTIIFIAHEERAKRTEDYFFQLVGQQFQVEDVPLEKMHPVYRDRSIHIFKLTKRHM